MPFFWADSGSERFASPLPPNHAPLQRIFAWDTEYQPTGQHIEHIQYELDMGPCALMRPSG